MVVQEFSISRVSLRISGFVSSLPLLNHTQNWKCLATNSIAFDLFVYCLWIPLAPSYFPWPLQFVQIAPFQIKLCVNEINQIDEIWHDAIYALLQYGAEQDGQTKFDISYQRKMAQWDSFVSERIKIGSNLLGFIKNRWLKHKNDNSWRFLLCVSHN